MESFLTPKALCAVLSRAVINVHPCEYDAFGMTVCEAAAMGVPSLVESNGNVGASAIVGDGASIEIDISQGQYSSDTLTSMLNDEQALKRIGEEAKKRALTWDEAAYGRKLLEYLNAVR
jgi:glycosyltransferase involved in cell wall biosynthesis